MSQILNILRFETDPFARVLYTDYNTFMSLSATDLQNIEAILDRKFDEKLAPISGELTALRNDVIEIYEMITPRWKKLLRALGLLPQPV